MAELAIHAPHADVTSRALEASQSHTQSSFTTTMSALLASSFVSRVAAFKATKVQVRKYVCVCVCV